MPGLKHLLLLLVSGCIFKTATAKSVDITLTEAIKQGLVTVSGQSSGQAYNESGLKLTIGNNGKKTLNITVDPALIFIPADTAYQDLVVAGNIKMVVAPSDAKSVLLQTYCGKSDANAPAKDLAYRFEKQADSFMIKTLAFAKSRNISAELTQKAVWVLTDHHNIRNIYEPSNDAASKELVRFMARLLGGGAPDYYNYYVLNKTPDAPVLPKKPLRIYTLFKWEMQQEDKLSLGVYNEKGELIQRMFEGQVFKAGGYELNARFESSNEPAGAYYIRLFSGKETIKETKVMIE